MKKNLLFLLVIAITHGVFSQAPQKMSYQGVVRNTTGTLVTNQSIGMKISIMQGSPTGIVVYSEICDPHPQTNANGLVTAEIGSGQVINGNITAIDWSAGPYFLKTETDPAGGTNYTIVGTSELLSVPYSQYAKKAGNVFSGNYDDLINRPLLFSGNYLDLTNKPDLFSGIYDDLLNKPALFSGFWDDIMDKPNTIGGYGISDAMSTAHPANNINETNIVNWNSAFGWGNHAGLYKLSSYVPAWAEITGKPAFSAVALSGTFADLLSKPTTLAGYGITDAMKTSHVANGITSTMITNWHTAYSWGPHSGLYRPVSYVPAWSEITGKPVFATVATSGSYNDLNNKPSIINSQWTNSGSDIYYNSGNVGIGVSSPRYILEINGGNYSYIKFFNNTSGTGSTDGFVIGTTPIGNPVWIWNYELGNIHFGINNTNRMVITSDGHVNMMGYLNVNSGVALGAALKVNDTEALWWNGTYFSWGYGGTYNYFADKVTIGNSANPGYMLYVQGTAYATGSWNSSDACFKKNISEIDHSLDKLMKIRGTRFEFRKDEYKDYQFSEGPQFGFIAQELENILPELVNTDSNGYKSVNYNGMIPVLLEAIKEQQKTIDQLKTENKLIKTENDQVNVRLEKLEGIIYGQAYKLSR